MMGTPESGVQMVSWSALWASTKDQYSLWSGTKKGTTSYQLVSTRCEGTASVAQETAMQLLAELRGLHRVDIYSGSGLYAEATPLYWGTRWLRVQGGRRSSPAERGKRRSSNNLHPLVLLYLHCGEPKPQYLIGLRDPYQERPTSIGGSVGAGAKSQPSDCNPDLITDWCTVTCKTRPCQAGSVDG